MSNSSIWPIDGTLSGDLYPNQYVPGSDGNEEVVCIPQSSSTTGIIYCTLVGGGVLPLCREVVGV